MQGQTSYAIVVQAWPRSRHRDGPGAGAKTATFNIGAVLLANDATCHVARDSNSHNTDALRSSAQAGRVGSSIGRLAGGFVRRGAHHGAHLSRQHGLDSDPTMLRMNAVRTRHGAHGRDHRTTHSAIIVLQPQVHAGSPLCVGCHLSSALVGAPSRSSPHCAAGVRRRRHTWRTLGLKRHKARCVCLHPCLPH